ncbi:NFATC2-interacting protein-like isoform X2 [Dendrobates tinctorius]|uniref:NFATC2-interacting protein-like isoform X2 n=1 Tax=Dendrobates tinctorius TaxID=92724 RepID=UPI003CCA487C
MGKRGRRRALRKRAAPAAIVGDLSILAGEDVTDHPEEQDGGDPPTKEPAACEAARTSPAHRYEQRDDDGHSSDSDVAIIVPRRAKRRRILQGTVPVTATVYSNKVNSSLTLIPDNLNTLAHMEKELQKKQGCEDLESEVPVEPPQVHLATTTYDVSDPDEEQNDKTTPCDRVRDSSPSPPPTPKTPVRTRKKRMNQKIRKMEERLQDLGTVLSPVRNSDNDVIVLGSSPPPEIIIKVRRRGKIFRINIRPTDTLEKLVESVASRLEVASSQILLLRGDEELDIKETPQSLNLTVADIIDCVVHSSSRDPGSDGQCDEICLKVQGKDKQSHLSVTIGMTEPFQTLMDQYKAAMGLSNNVCFMFEGQKLNGRNTAQELGLESEDIIEAWA